MRDVFGSRVFSIRFYKYTLEREKKEQKKEQKKDTTKRRTVCFFFIHKYGTHTHIHT